MRSSLLLLPIVLLASLSVVACDATKGGSSSGGSSSGDGSSGGASGGPGGSSGSSGSSSGATALPLTTFLFVKHVGQGKDHLMAHDMVTRQTTLVTDLTGDGSDGWQIDGFDISPDRTKIVISSNYGPVAADNLSGLAPQRIWMLDANGQSFVRLTPPFKPSSSSVRQIDVRNPAFSRDGASVLYDYGTATGAGGYVAPWIVAAEADQVPTLFPTSEPACSNVVQPSTNPKSGEILIQHGVCSNEEEDGFWIYPPTGSTTPKQVFQSKGKGLSVTTSTPRWSADGTAFLFTAVENATSARSLFVWGADNGGTYAKILQGSDGARIWNGTFAHDNSAIVTCVHEGANGAAENLHVLDLTVDPAVDSVLTDDGASCDPRF